MSEVPLWIASTEVLWGPDTGKDLDLKTRRALFTPTERIEVQTLEETLPRN